MVVARLKFAAFAGIGFYFHYHQTQRCKCFIFEMEFSVTTGGFRQHFTVKLTTNIQLKTN